MIGLKTKEVIEALESTVDALSTSEKCSITKKAIINTMTMIDTALKLSNLNEDEERSLEGLYDKAEQLLGKDHGQDV
tara:strand:- start:7675 stop:7905 length:231 start_codon:yes stop_codon:yes gene_type:complete